MQSNATLKKIKGLMMSLFLILGFVFFIAAFYTIYINYAINSQTGRRLFKILASVWTLYGIVYYFPPIYQNMSLNALDVVAKNFFGIFLYYKII